MNIIERFKPLFSQSETGDNDVFSWSGYGKRILLYGSVLVSLILAGYDFQLDEFYLGSDSQPNVKDNEPLAYVSSINKGQEFYFAENGKFTNSIADLELGLKMETTDYIYQIISANGPVQTLDNATNMVPYFESVITVSRPKKENLWTYIGVVFAIKNNQKSTDSLTTISAICETDGNKDLPSTLPTLSYNLEISCPPNSKIVNR